MTEIKFGTSGWRGILAEDFTFPNARLVCQAIADYLQQEGLAHQGVVIGYDTRFRSEAFAATAAEVMAGNGITSHLTTRDCPTPVVSFAIRDGKRAGGINITASHNPPEYNGLKFSPATGGPAPADGDQAHRVPHRRTRAPPRSRPCPWPPPGKRVWSSTWSPGPPILSTSRPWWTSRC